MKACFEEDVQFLIQYFIDLGRLSILKGVLAHSKKYKSSTEVRMRSSIFYGLYSVGEINILPDMPPKYLLSQEYSGEHIGRTLRTYKELENSLQTINIYIANIEQEINQQTEKVTDAQDILGQLSEGDKKLIQLVYQEKLSYRQISEFGEMSLSRSALHGRMKKILWHISVARQMMNSGG